MSYHVHAGKFLPFLGSYYFLFCSWPAIMSAWHFEQRFCCLSDSDDKLRVSKWEYDMSWKGGTVLSDKGVCYLKQSWTIQLFCQPWPAAASEVVTVKMHNSILSPPYQIKCPADGVVAAVGSSAQRLASSCSTVTSNLNGALRFLAQALVCNSHRFQRTREEMSTICCRVFNLFYLWSYS